MRALYSSARFKREFARLPRAVRLEANEAAQLLRDDPLDPTFDPIQLTDVRGTLYRVQIGEYRLIYSFTSKTLLLVAVGHRRDIYRSF